MCKVLFASSEASPFAKVGGLGDVVGALPKYLNKIGVTTSIVIPKYKNINLNSSKNIEYIKSFNVQVGWRNQEAKVYKTIYNNTEVYLIDNDYYFKRREVYGYEDEGERFCFFSKAVLSMLKEINYKPDIIHCNDWHTAIIPVLLKELYCSDEFYTSIKTVYTIHNLLYQGVFHESILPELLNLNMDIFHNGRVRHYDSVNFTKGGITYCDKFVTVSKSYSLEIQTKEYGEGLEELIYYEKGKLRGIINGIDYDSYNPESDEELFQNYNENDFKEKKRINKGYLQRLYGLKEDDNIPLIAVISRLTSQKGIDLIINALERLMTNEEVQVIILGTGDKDYESHIKKLAYMYKDRFIFENTFNEELSHKVYGGSDMLFMPSKFEPCGISQLIALRYGTLPIVRETGGLKDTIIPYNEYTGEGNGFSFTNYDFNDFYHVIDLSLRVYKEKDQWNSMVYEAMKSDNSFEKSAKEYKEIYDSLITAI
ncbi:glycogen synthase GlgA [Clostridium hydrogeniformans]|uniref:glycogen synthase GlgA n=1 Tax=Clostridium hydrogeniformans TaxID=349933 RepID=UPI00048337E8|nr:glycogen synthase GlgA [Clostridium hydrogeniformans]